MNLNMTPHKMWHIIKRRWNTQIHARTCNYNCCSTYLFSWFCIKPVCGAIPWQRWFIVYAGRLSQPLSLAQNVSCVCDLWWYCLFECYCCCCCLFSPKVFESEKKRCVRLRHGLVCTINKYISINVCNVCCVVCVMLVLIWHIHSKEDRKPLSAQAFLTSFRFGSLKWTVNCNNLFEFRLYLFFSLRFSFDYCACVSL